MNDNILQVKEDMRRAMKSKGITRMEKYNLLIERRAALSDRERKILLNECRRDYESTARFRGINELVSIFISGLGMFITLFGISYKYITDVDAKFQEMVIITAVYLCISIIMVTVSHVISSGSMDISKQIIDILEDR